MTTRVENSKTYTQVFDAENRLVSVTVDGQTTQFVYNGDGAMVKMIHPDGSYVEYAGSVYEVEKTSGGTTVHTTIYYPAGGAMRVDGTLYYVIKDHLGSASLTLDNSGAVVGRQTYAAFGETRTSTGDMLTDRLYTGQRALEELGIYYYNARWYDPNLNRFLSADTMVPGAADSQAYDRYSYSRNNPVRFFDPDGHAPRCNNDNGEGGGCEGLSRPIPGIRHKGYTRLTPAGETAYLAFQRYLESDLPDKTVTGFVTLILAGEFNGIEESNVRRSTGGSSYAAFQTYIAEAAAHQLYSRFGAGSFNDSAMLNWMGEYMDSYFSRLNEPNYVFTYDGISPTGQELSKYVMDRIINSPAEWRRPDYGSTEHNNYWNGQYQPLNWEPKEWGNGSMYPGVDISGVLSGYTYWYIDDPNPDKRFYVLSIEESNLLTNALSNK